MTRTLLPLLLIAACVHTGITQRSATPASAPPQARPTTADGAPITLFHHMVEHYASITTARDQIARGQVEHARKELGWLATHPPDPALSEAQEAMVAAMQQEAAGVYAADTPGDAARALTRSAVWCGRCHAASAITVGVDDTPPPQGEGVLPHMLRHRWMVDRLWEGLIGPSDEAWKRGADALIAEAALPVSATTRAEGRDVAVDVMARFVHEAGWTAEEATTDDQRARALGDLLATCADCHAETRPKP